MQGQWQQPAGQYLVGGATHSSAPPAQGNTEGGFGDYEFNDKENLIVGAAASKTSKWGIISLVLGILNVGIGAVMAMHDVKNVTSVFSGVVSIIVGISFYLAGGSLKAVTTTKGNDMRHMMQALRRLDGAFLTQIVTSLVITLVMILFVAGAFAAAIAKSAH